MRVNAVITGQLKIQQKAQNETWKRKQLKKLIVQNEINIIKYISENCIDLNVVHFSTFSLTIT